MANFLCVIGVMLLLLVLPVSVIITIVFAVKKKNILVSAICMPASLIVGVIFLGIGGYMYGQTDEYKQYVLVNKQQEESEKISPKSNEEDDTKEKSLSEKYYLESDYLDESPNEEKNTSNDSDQAEEKKELTEEEYKKICEDLYYDDIFFGDNDLEGKNVKLHLFLSEKYFFTASDMRSDTLKSYFDKYNLKKDFYKCCVLRKDTNSYVGRQINMWFTDNFEIDANEYEVGEKLVVYAEVIAWSNNTWKGYNSVTIIPKYIEEENYIER